jgi:hypothetical protein
MPAGPVRTPEDAPVPPGSLAGKALSTSTCHIGSGSSASAASSHAGASLSNVTNPRRLMDFSTALTAIGWQINGRRDTVISRPCRLRVIHDRIEPTTGAAMSAMLRITPRGPSLSVPRATIFKSASGNGLCSALPHPMARASTRAFCRRCQGHPGIGFGRIGRDSLRG